MRSAPEAIGGAARSIAEPSGGAAWAGIGRVAAARTGGARVVHLIDGLGDGGAERVLAETVPRLARLGLDVRVIVLQDRRGNPMAEVLARAGVPVELVPVDRLRNLAQVRRLFARLSALQPAVIHAHLEFASVLGSVAGRWLGVPVTATLHTIDQPTGWSRSELHVRLMHHVLGRLCGTVVCLTGEARRVAERTPLRRAELAVLANGIDLGRWTRMEPGRREAVRAALGVPEAAPLLVCVAVLRRPKGVVHLVHAMAAIRRRHEDARLLVVGDGPEAPAIAAAVRRLGLGEAVILAGRREDVPDMMLAADVFVLPTLADALPTVLMEAMAAGLPVVASRVGGIPEMVTDGVEGFLVPPGDEERLAAACGWLLASPTMRRLMGQAGRARAGRDFDLARQALRQVELYRRLAAAGGGR